MSTEEQTLVMLSQPSNYLGATIFWLYIILALVFTSITARTLLSLSASKRPKKRQNSGQVFLFSALAVLSFATLSRNMLEVLIQSFNQWSIGLQPLPSNELPLRIWQWSTRSTLFRDFGEAIVSDSARFIWVQSALLATLSMFFYMGTEGRHREVPRLWAFFCLGQILPISFAQNLFYIALILSPAKADQIHFNKSAAVGSAGFYCLCLACAQLVAGTDRLVPLILAARAALMTPLFLKAGHIGAGEKPTIDRATSEEGQRVILKAALIMSGMKAYQAVQEGWDVGMLFLALRDHPAVTALGYDFLLSAVSFAIWTLMGPKDKPTAGNATATSTKVAEGKSTGRTQRVSGRRGRT